MSPTDGVRGSQGVPQDNTQASQASDMVPTYLTKRSDSIKKGSSVPSESFKTSSEESPLLSKTDKDLEKDEEKLKKAFLNPKKINISFLKTLISDEPLIT